jgi:hypothetical protein
MAGAIFDTLRLAVTARSCIPPGRGVLPWDSFSPAAFLARQRLTRLLFLSRLSFSSMGSSIGGRELLGFSAAFLASGNTSAETNPRK